MLLMTLAEEEEEEEMVVVACGVADGTGRGGHRLVTVVVTVDTYGCPGGMLRAFSADGGRLPPSIPEKLTPPFSMCLPRW